MCMRCYREDPVTKLKVDSTVDLAKAVLREHNGTKTGFVVEGFFLDQEGTVNLVFERRDEQDEKFLRDRLPVLTAEFSTDGVRRHTGSGGVVEALRTITNTKIASKLELISCPDAGVCILRVNVIHMPIG